MNAQSILAAEFIQLVSFYKPLLMLITFLPWAWLISSKLDKDARYFHLNNRMWNGIYLGCGVAALATTLVIPIFWISWPAGILVLYCPIYVYWQVRNRSVPEGQQFTFTGEGISAKLASRKQSRATHGAAIQFIDNNNKNRDVPLKEEPLYIVHVLAEDLIGPALAARASEIRLEIGAAGCNVTQLIDGVRYKREAVPVDVALKMIDYLKDISGLNIEDRRRTQKSNFSMSSTGTKTQIAVNTRGSSSGQLMTLTFDRAEKLQKPFDGLGLLGSQLEALRKFELEHERHGIFLIGAPKGHGLTTSSYSFISRHDAYTSNIKTLEIEVQTHLDGVDQIAWDPSNRDVDYSTNLQSILRRDPDLVLTAQIPDRETGSVVAGPGMSGPLIYIPQAVSTIAEQIRSWVSIVGDLKTAAKSLRAVTNQRLLRTLCPNCKQPYQPSAQQLQKMNLPSNKIKQLFGPGGKIQVKNKIEACPVCGGTGYLGQTAVFEVMIVDSEIQRLLTAGDLKGALAHARRNKMIYLQEAALSKVIKGETSIEEVARVTASAKANGRSSATRKTPKPQVDPAASAT
ncbi:MAG: Flp pilus assembly complex ATPase component TadA [Planctomycetes bacterium]|nr:Flp pilus assembly complex ATPase component TadA [Planctomycetota bacterium]